MWLPVENLDQQIIKDLVINSEEHVPKKQPKEDGDWKKFIIKKAFKKIKAPVISSIIYYSRISDPSNS
jgi:hypothetical protein